MFETRQQEHTLIHTAVTEIAYFPFESHRNNGGALLPLRCQGPAQTLYLKTQSMNKWRKKIKEQKRGEEVKCSSLEHEGKASHVVGVPLLRDFIFLWC